MISDLLPISRQRGMTLPEILIALAIFSLLCGLVFSPSLTAMKSRSKAAQATADFERWYAAVQHAALYQPVLHRICTNGQKLVAQYYRPSIGWQDSTVVYIPPRGVTIESSPHICSPLLNSGDTDEFIQKVHFLHTL